VTQKVLKTVSQDKEAKSQLLHARREKCFFVAVIDFAMKKNEKVQKNVSQLD
jgi:hypothetical protein